MTNLDNLDPRDLHRDDATSSPDATRQPQEQESMLSDREVPLASAGTPNAIHAWLDGEAVSEDQLRASGKEYAFWQKIESETARRRRMKTPASVPVQIMRAIEKDEER